MLICKVIFKSDKKLLFSEGCDGDNMCKLESEEFFQVFKFQELGGKYNAHPYKGLDYIDHGCDQLSCICQVQGLFGFGNLKLSL